MSNEMISVPRHDLALALGTQEEGVTPYLQKRAGDRLRALLAKPAEQGQGEPVYQFAVGSQSPSWVDVSEESHNEYKRRGGWLTRVLYPRPAEQPTPVAVVLPSADDLRSIIRKAARDADLMPGANYYTAAELAAEDVVSEVARLNPPQQ